MRNRFQGRLARVLRTLSMLQDASGGTVRVLAERLGVSARTVLRDIASLRDADVAIEYDKVHQCYSVRRSVDLRSGNLTEHQIAAVTMLVARYGCAGRDDPIVRLAMSAVAKLVNRCSERARQVVSGIMESVRFLNHIEPFSSTPDLPSFNTMQAGAIGKRRVRLTIRSEKTKTLFSPYSLVLKDGVWSVVGRSSVHRAIKTLSFDDISELELTEDHFSIPPRFKAEKWFQVTEAIDGESRESFGKVG